LRGFVFDRYLFIWSKQGGTARMNKLVPYSA